MNLKVLAKASSQGQGRPVGIVPRLGLAAKAKAAPHVHAAKAKALYQKGKPLCWPRQPRGHGAKARACSQGQGALPKRKTIVSNADG